MKHHPNCKDQKHTTVLSLSATERVKQCDYCGAFENLTNTFSVADFSALEHRVSLKDFSTPDRPSTQAEFNEQYLCTPTGRTPRPFNPEPHNLPRSRPTLCVLVCDGRRPPRWASHLEVTLLYVSFLQIVIDVSDEHAPYCPIKWQRPFDIHAFDRARGNNG